MKNPRPRPRAPHKFFKVGTYEDTLRTPRAQVKNQAEPRRDTQLDRTLRRALGRSRDCCGLCWRPLTHGESARLGMTATGATVVVGWCCAGGLKETFGAGVFIPTDPERRASRLEQMSDRLLSKVSSACTLCNHPLDDCDMTYTGATYSGTVAMVGNCCHHQMKKIVAGGIFLFKEQVWGGEKSDGARAGGFAAPGVRS